MKSALKIQQKFLHLQKSLRTFFVKMYPKKFGTVIYAMSLCVNIIITSWYFVDFRIVDGIDNDNDYVNYDSDTGNTEIVNPIELIESPKRIKRN